jgi:pheromone a factor receptor
MTIIAFRKRHAEFKEILSANCNLNSNRFLRLMVLAGIELTCCIPFTITTLVLNATRGEVRPWISWEDTHYGKQSFSLFLFLASTWKIYHSSGFSRVDQFPAMIWRSDTDMNTGIEMTRWLMVVCGLIFFAFFGFADEAQKHYKIAFDSVAKRVGYTTTGSTKVGPGITSSTGYVPIFFRKVFHGLNSFPSFNKFKGVSSNIASSQGVGIPIFVRQEVVEKRDSFDDTLSDMTSIRESIYGSETGSNPSSPFNTLTKPSIAENAQGLKPPGVSSSESMRTAPTVVETAPYRPNSFPGSVTPSGSFLDLSTPKEGPGNDNKV